MTSFSHPVAAAGGGGAFSHVRAMLYHTPLAMRAEVADLLAERLEGYMAHRAGRADRFSTGGNGGNGGFLVGADQRHVPDAGMFDYDDDDDSPAPPMVEFQNGVARLRIHGIMGRHLSQLDMMCGGCDVDAVRRAIPGIMARMPRVLMLDMSSPGGSVQGLAELFSAIMQARADRPEMDVLAYTDSECCSAAYHIASAAHEIHAAPSAVVGSLGVIVKWVDNSEMLAAAGVRREVVATGIHKSTGWGPVTVEQRQEILARVNASWEEFQRHIRTREGAKNMPPEAMQGQWWFASHAPAGVLDTDYDGGDVYPDADAFFAAVQAA